MSFSTLFQFQRDVELKIYKFKVWRVHSHSHSFSLSRAWNSLIDQNKIVNFSNGLVFDPSFFIRDSRRRKIYIF